MSPNKLVFVAPEKNPWLSLRKGWPYSHGSVCSTVAANCNTPVAFMAHIIRVSHVRMDLFLHAAYWKWVIIIAVLMTSLNITSKFIYSHQFLMNPKLNLEKLTHVIRVSEYKLCTELAWSRAMLVFHLWVIPHQCTETGHVLRSLLGLISLLHLS